MAAIGVCCARAITAGGRQTRGQYNDVNANGAGCSKHLQMLLINEAWTVIVA